MVDTRQNALSSRTGTGVGDLSDRRQIHQKRGGRGGGGFGVWGLGGGRGGVHFET